jgi:hypothetical protein
MRARKSDGTKYRNRLALAMYLRHPRKAKIKDRRTPRGGAKNKQKEYLGDLEDA